MKSLKSVAALEIGPAISLIRLTEHNGSPTPELCLCSCIDKSALKEVHEDAWAKAHRGSGGFDSA